MRALNAFAPAAEPLVSIDNVIPISDSDQVLFQELHQVLKKHGALSRFGITLLHQHFKVADDEILLETTDKIRREQTIQPVKKSALEGKKYVETSWRLDTGQPLLTCVCVVNPAGHDHRNVQ